MGNLSDLFGQAFDPSAVDQTGSFSVIPPGKYPVMVESSEIAPNRKGTGHLIKVTLWPAPQKLIHVL